MSSTCGLYQVDSFPISLYDLIKTMETKRLTDLIPMAEENMRHEEDLEDYHKKSQKICPISLA